MRHVSQALPPIFSKSKCQKLAHIAERDDDRRARQRSRTLLMQHSGKPLNAVATEQGINRITVHRDAWLAKGLDGLCDAPRSGAPRKLPSKHIQVMFNGARAEALTAPQLRERLQEHFNVKVNIWEAFKTRSAKKPGGSLGRHFSEIWRAPPVDFLSET